MKLYITYSMFFIWIVVHAQTQIEQFNIIHDGKTVGTLRATKSNQGNQTIYTSHTNLEYSLLVAIKIDYNYEVSFINNSLNEAFARVEVGGNTKTNVRTIKTGSVYKFYSETNLEKVIKEPIHHSIVQLLFSEPVGVTKIYAEEHGEFHILKKIADFTYSKTNSKGQKNIYYFKNNMLQKCDVDAGLIKFSIVRLEN